jgi:hypothetical protein
VVGGVVVGDVEILPLLPEKRKFKRCEFFRQCPLVLLVKVGWLHGAAQEI